MYACIFFMCACTHASSKAKKKTLFPWQENYVNDCMCIMYNQLYLSACYCKYNTINYGHNFLLFKLSNQLGSQLLSKNKKKLGPHWSTHMNPCALFKKYRKNSTTPLSLIVGYSVHQCPCHTLYFFVAPYLPPHSTMQQVLNGYIHLIACSRCHNLDWLSFFAPRTTTHLILVTKNFVRYETQINGIYSRSFFPT